MNAPATSTAGDDCRDPAIDAALAEDPAVVALAEQLYGHVLDCIDFDALFQLEQLLWCFVSDLRVADLDEEGDLSRALIERAIVRAASDPETRWKDVPYGITKEEAKAVRFDEACPFCRAEDERAGEADEHEHGDGSCPCCDDLAREWRAQHAGALLRRGLRAENKRKGGRS